MYADLYGISVDLSDARDMANVLIREMGEERPNWQLVEPYSIAIAVKYSRCFVTGIRERLKEEALSILGSEQRQAHERIRSIRDKHIAHSINAFEENVPRANYCQERLAEDGITGIGCSHGRIVGLSLDDLNNVVELATVLLSHVGTLMDQEKEKLLALVKEMPIEDVLSEGQKGFKVNGNVRPDKPRRRSRT